MRIVEIIALRIGSVASTMLDDREQKFYLDAANLISGDECSIAHGASLITVAIDAHIVNDQPFQVYTLFLSAVQGINPKADILLVHLGNPSEIPIRGVFFIHLGHAIEVFLRQWNKDNGVGRSRQLILLLPEMPPLNDSFRTILDPYLKSGKVILIADDGTFIPESLPPGLFDAESYRVKLAATRYNPMDLMKLKMIRRIGHYPRFRDGKHYECVRYFFDGKLCSPEIRILLELHIKEAYGEKNLPCILYHSTISDWLGNPLKALCDDLKLHCFRVEDLNRPVTLRGSKRNPVLLVVPMTDTGETVSLIAEQFTEKHPDRELHVLSILSTKGSDETFGTRTLPHASGAITLHYLLRVKQERYIAGLRSCQQCRLGVPLSSYDFEQYSMLSSYDFWDMVRKAGVKSEDDIPKNRNGLSVPDFPKILQENGPWLANKISDAIALATRESLQDTVIVCPAGEEGSKVLSQYLEVVSGSTVIRVPREIIDLFYGDNYDIEELRETWELLKPVWYIQLSTTHTSQVVILDEFVMSGGTFFALQKMLCHFHQSVSCFVMLLDLNLHKRQDLGVPCHALYEWQQREMLEGEDDGSV